MLHSNELMQTVFWACWTRWSVVRGGPFFWMRRLPSRSLRQPSLAAVSQPRPSFWRSNQSWGMFLGLIGVSVVGIIDCLTGPEISPFIFYLLLITLVGWFCGKRAGLVMTIACTAAWMTVEWHHGLPQAHPFVMVWKILVNPVFFFIFNTTLWNFRRRLEQARQFAHSDFLTGLANRRGFYEQSKIELERARRHELPLTVSYLDLDHFKEVNDSLGHFTGDLVLCHVARILEKNLRLTDIAVRLGGDEFALLLPETDAASARIILNKLWTLLLEGMRQKNWPVTFSIGVVTFLAIPTSIDDMLQAADRCMYVVKGNGKNTLRHEVLSGVDA